MGTELSHVLQLRYEARMSRAESLSNANTTCLYELTLTVNWSDLNLAQSRVHSHVQSSISFFTVCDVVYAVVAHFWRGLCFLSCPFSAQQIQTVRENRVQGSWVFTYEISLSASYGRHGSWVTEPWALSALELVLSHFAALPCGPLLHQGADELVQGKARGRAHMRKRQAQARISVFFSNFLMEPGWQASLETSLYRSQLNWRNYLKVLLKL
jgi:hypothetical protein